ncbi:putative bifunctional diguanylate cyclase/phosphodiesterase [Flavisphingomonas formosensis]|uniref:putative bifunctional diguanylate cyclase/phosphodiesterase n=1 Tax=Flavisphingomonas formosensis TaxID=861534 RepID=UPI0012FC59A1|nr:EAL domain-containing protein [Sphingomonas formosensis]
MHRLGDDAARTGDGAISRLWSLTRRPDLRGALAEVQFHRLSRQAPILYALLTINTLLTAYAAKGHVPRILWLHVPALLVTIFVARMMVWLSRLGQDAPAERIGPQLRRTVLTARALSLMCGAWGLALLETSDAVHSQFVPMFIAMGSFASAYCLSVLPAAAFSSIFLATLPVCIALILSGERTQIAIGLDFLIIAMLILRLIGDQFGQLVKEVAAQTRTRRLAYYDQLTGLPNRRAFIELLDARVEARRGDRAGFAVAMFDLDGFKPINDSYGHAAGDQILAQLARRLSLLAEPSHVVARLGGDEFAILLHDITEEAAARAICERFVRALDAPFQLARSQIRLSGSLGLALHPHGGNSASELIARADQALYRAKALSGGQVALFSPAMEEALRRQIAIEQALRDIGNPPDIRIVFQPILGLSGKRIVAVEALARWNHPELGPLNPAEFIQIAEQTGIIVSLTEALFERAIAEAACWSGDVHLSFNLSAVQLRSASTPATLMAVMDRYGFDPRRLEIEVTETAVLTDLEAARQIFDALRARGIRIVLDDFGAGYASIFYLKEIMFDAIKIDGDLVASITATHRSRALLEGILQLCAATGLEATAEKVETKDQLALLDRLGCSRVQGYLIGRPMDSDAIGRILAETIPSTDRIARLPFFR